MPEVPKKPAPEKKVPVPAPKHVEPPPAKGTPAKREYTVFIASPEKLWWNWVVGKIYIYKVDSHIFTSKNVQEH